jgi:hypothetical protein
MRRGVWKRKRGKHGDEVSIMIEYVPRLLGWASRILLLISPHQFRTAVDRYIRGLSNFGA